MRAFVSDLQYLLKSMKASGRIATLLMVLAFTACHSEPPPTIPSSPRAHDASFQSAALGRTMKYRVLLPAGYDQSARRYPVLYLLHGAYGDGTDWTRLTHVAQYTDALPLIVVMPDAKNSWYINSAARLEDRYEDYIVNDLVAEIDAKYRTISTREARAIAGNSMGGYGAVLFGLKYPDRFAFVGSFGGAIAAARREGSDLYGVFGPPGSATRAVNDAFILAEKQPAAGLPYVWLACGDADSNTDENQPFTAILERRKIAYKYIESPGGHQWKVWDAQLPAMLSELPRHMELASKPTQVQEKRGTGKTMAKSPR